MSKQISLIGERVTHVYLQSELFMPGIGGLGTVLPPSNKTLNLVMYHTEEGVFVSIDNGKYRALTPWANVKLTTYLSEDKAKLEAVPMFESTKGVSA